MYIYIHNMNFGVLNESKKFIVSYPQLVVGKAMMLNGWRFLNYDE